MLSRCFSQNFVTPLIVNSLHITLKLLLIIAKILLHTLYRQYVGSVKLQHFSIYIRRVNTVSFIHSI